MMQVEIKSYSTMSRCNYGEKTRGLVLGLLSQNMSYNQIISYLKEKNISVSKSYISKLKNSGKKKLSKKKIGRPSKLPKRQISDLRKKFLKEDSPTITSLADELSVTRASILYYRDKFGLKKRKKRRVHALTERAHQQRYARSWPLYLAMRGDRWKKWITSDEKTFVLFDCNNRSEIYYKDPNAVRDPLTLPKKPQGAQSIMVWAAISFNGKSSLCFIKPKAKIN